MKIIIKILFLISVLFPHFSNAQQDDFQFNRFNVKDGLPHTIINSIYRDSKGFMWFATMDGICRFDGYKYQVYKNNLEDSLSLSHNSVFDVIEDPKGYLWISTYSGLNKFDRKTSGFSSFFIDKKIKTSSSKNFFLKLKKDKNGRIWSIVADKGLHIFDPETNSFSEIIFSEDNPQNPQNVNVSGFLISGSDEVWFVASTENKAVGLYRYNIKNQSLQRYLHNPSNPENSLGISGLTTVFEDKNGNIWIGHTNGLEKLEVASGKFKHYCPDKNNLESFPSGTVEAIAEDDNGMIWIGTKENGLIRLNPETNEFIHLKNDPKNQNSISSNHIISLFNDHKGILWIGTANGLNQLILHKKAFNNYLHETNEDLIFNTSHITDLYKDKNGVLWFCNEKGLNRYDLHSEPELVLSINCKELVQDQKGNFWLIGNGLTKFDPVTKKTTLFQASPDNPDSLNSNNIWSLYIDGEENLWMGTGGGGLNKMDLKTGKVTHYLHDSINANSIATNEVGPILRVGDELWIGPFKGGLNKIDLKSGKITRYIPDPNDKESLSNDIVAAIHKDKKGRLWVGTYQGLNVLEKDQKKFQRIKEEDGLASGRVSVNGISEDKNGNIWVSTAVGISKIHPETFAIRNYDSRDGFQKNPEATTYQDRDGKIYMFGKNGITIFQPEEIEENKLPPQISFTDFLLFNKSIAPDHDGPLKEEIDATKKITLSYKEAFITFEFAAHNYLLTEKNQYAYRMEGFDEDWIPSGNRRYATYTNLPPGKTYTFRVKASNNDGVWNEEGTAIELYIIPPFWQTWWFYSLLCIIFIMALYGLYRWRTRQHYLQRKMLETMVKDRTEEVEAQKEALEEHANHLKLANREIILKNKKIIRQSNKLKVIDKLKSEFLTNISHEFRTPLTLILAPLEEMISAAGNDEAKAQLSVMNRNARRLLQLINQLLDLSKLESSTLPLELSQGDIMKHLRAMFFSFNYLAQKRNINYGFKSNIETYSTRFDSDKLEKIVYNLIANAFKFTPDKGEIKVEVSINTSSPESKSIENECKYLHIAISDTGIGISSEHLPSIFDRFYQAESNGTKSHEGTGIGLALTKELVNLLSGEIKVKSKPGKGTTFNIILPLNEPDQDMNNDSFIITSKLSPDILQEAKESEIRIESFPFIHEQKNTPLLLVVEDNEDLRHLIKKIFSQHYRVEEAEDGIQGWEIANKKLPDLIISDVMMPGKDGLALCTQLKNDPNTSHIPTILLSARIDGEEAGLSKGADDYITKPFNARTLLLKVQNLLETRQKLRNHLRKELGKQSINADENPGAISLQDKSFLEKATEIANAYLNDVDFEMETLYRELGMSRTLVYKKMKSLTGLGPNEFIRHIRLNKAAELLSDDKLTVAEVMFQVGFNHRSYFIKCFKKQFGHLPSEFASK